MSRSLDQILSEVTAKSDPQRQTVLSQIADLPNQQAAQTAAVGAQKDQANQDILDGARRRGLGFSGIPLGEQAKYAATTYAPALANLGTSFNDRKGTLESALSQIGQNDYTTANGIYNQDRTFEEQQRQFNEDQAFKKQQAAQSQAGTASGSGSSLASLYGGGQPTQSTGGIGAGFRVPGDPSKGFSFVDNNNNVTNALQYSQGHQIPFRTLLQQMAGAGDAGAKAGLQFIGNDGNADPTKITSQALADLYYSLTGRRVSVFKAPTPTRAAPQQGFRPPQNFMNISNPLANR